MIPIPFSLNPAYRRFRWFVVGQQALEELHRIVMPFVLRRLKEEVLQDLPPKVIQDYLCNMTPLQVRLRLAISLLFILSLTFSSLNFCGHSFPFLDSIFCGFLVLSYC